MAFSLQRPPTPSGRFHCLQKAADDRSRTYDKSMPFMLRLTADGVAIHGSDVREGRAKHGCIGVPEDFARGPVAEMHVRDAVFVQR